MANNGITPEMMEQIKKAKQILNGNPQEMIGKLAQQNPMIGTFVSMSQSGQSLEGIFNAACQQKGIDPQAFINALKE